MTNNALAFDFKKLVIEKLPTFRRLPKRIAMLLAFIEPLKRLHNDFIVFKDAMNYKQSHTSQVVYMRAMLNDGFDPDERRILIKSAPVREPIWLYRNADDKPNHVHRVDLDSPTHLYRSVDFTLNQPDFTVILPIEIQPAESSEIELLLNKMRAQIDYYKLYSKNYNIVWTL